MDHNKNRNPFGILAHEEWRFSQLSHHAGPHPHIYLHLFILPPTLFIQFSLSFIFAPFHVFALHSFFNL